MFQCWFWIARSRVNFLFDRIKIGRNISAMDREKKKKKNGVRIERDMTSGQMVCRLPVRYEYGDGFVIGHVWMMASLVEVAYEIAMRFL